MTPTISQFFQNSGCLSDLLDRRSSGQSLYFQIIEILEKLIAEDKIQVGEYLPAQEELAKIFKVSRITIRNAVGDLNNRGIIVSEKAKGAKILKKPDRKTQFTGIGFSSRYQSLRINANTKIISIDMGIQDKKASQALEVEQGKELIRLKRLRLIGNVPVVLETAYICQDSKIESHFQTFESNSSLYELLFLVHGFQIGFAEEFIHTLICQDPIVQNLLEIKDVSVIYIERISRVAKYTPPVEYCEIYRIL